MASSYVGWLTGWRATIRCQGPDRVLLHELGRGGSPIGLRQVPPHRIRPLQTRQVAAETRSR